MRGEILSPHEPFLPSPLSASIRNLNYLKTKTFGFPIKDFGNDGGGSPLNGSIILLSLPLSASIVPYPSPLNGSIRGPQY